MLSGGGASPPESKHPYEWRNLDYGNLTAAPCQVPIATQVFPARAPRLKQDVDAVSVIAGHSVAHWYRGPSTSFVRRGGLTALRMTAEKHAASAQHDIRQRFCSVRISLRGAVTVRSFPFWNDCFDFVRNCIDSSDVGANDGYEGCGELCLCTASSGWHPQRAPRASFFDNLSRVVLITSRLWHSPRQFLLFATIRLQLQWNEYFDL